MGRKYGEITHLYYSKLSICGGARSLGSSVLLSLLLLLLLPVPGLALLYVFQRPLVGGRVLRLSAWHSGGDGRGGRGPTGGAARRKPVLLLLLLLWLLPLSLPLSTAAAAVVAVLSVRLLLLVGRVVREADLLLVRVLLLPSWLRLLVVVWLLLLLLWLLLP